MKLTLFTNYLNHHQLPFCLEMVKMLGNDFHFVASIPFNQSRLQHGYQDMNTQYGFVVRSYENEEQYKKAMELACTSDVIIIGSAPEKFLYYRMLTNPKGLTLRYSERLYKDNAGKINYLNPMFWWSYGINRLLTRENYYLLAASAYAPYDYVRSGFHRERILKWGYFPAMSKYSLDQIREKKCGKTRLIWVGRMIDWKHPEQAIEVARMLRDDCFDFEMVLVGTGPLADDVEKRIKKHNLQNYVVCLGSLPTEQVRTEMEKSHIHLFTSDYNEGWGAVLNESMASACVPVCSISVGAAPFLIEHGINGFLCEPEDAAGMYCRVKALIMCPERQKQMQEAAYRQICEQWNPAVAARNLWMVCSNRQKFDLEKNISGPCSKAECIEQEKMYSYFVKDE